MSTTVDRAHLGLDLAIGGGVYAIFAYASWYFLASSYARCAAGAQSFGCDSLAVDVGVWALQLVVCLGVVVAGAILRFSYRAPRGRGSRPSVP